MKRTWFVDLDGVLVDFIQGLDIKGIPYILKEGTWDCLGSNFDYEILDEEFWTNLRPTRWCYSILTALEIYVKRENICLLSTALTAGAMAGKFKWIRHHLNRDFLKRIHFVHTKKYLAGPTHYLLDDADHNLEAFNHQGILYPAFWNSRFALKDDAFVTFYKDLSNMEPY